MVLCWFLFEVPLLEKIRMGHVLYVPTRQLEEKNLGKKLPTLDGKICEKEKKGYRKSKKEPESFDANVRST